jgi:hypothetical protein
VLRKKNFSPETTHLFISLWSLSGKNLLFRTKLDLCTAVDNFPVIAPFLDREIRLFCRSFETIMKIASGMLSRIRTVIIWWRQRKWLALLSRLSYVRILETPAVLLTPLALSIESAMEFLLGREDLMMPVGLNRFAC